MKAYAKRAIYIIFMISVGFYLFDEYARSQRVEFPPIVAHNTNILDFFQKTEIVDPGKVFISQENLTSEIHFNYPDDVIAPLGYILDDLCVKFNVRCYLLPFGYVIIY